MVCLPPQGCSKDISIQELACGTEYGVKVCDFGYATNASLPLSNKDNPLGGPSQVLTAPQPRATLT
jgi:hypothetical protein